MLALVLLGTLELSINKHFIDGQFLTSDGGGGKRLDEKEANAVDPRMTEFLFAGDNKSFEREVRLLQRGSRKRNDLRTAGNY